MRDDGMCDGMYDDMEEDTVGSIAGGLMAMMDEDDMKVLSEMEGPMSDDMKEGLGEMMYEMFGDSVKADLDEEDVKDFKRGMMGMMMEDESHEEMMNAMKGKMME